MPNIPPEGALQRSIGYGRKTTAATRYRNTSGRPVKPLDQRVDAARVRIEQQGDPIGFLMDVMKGISYDAFDANGKRVKVSPTLDQRIDAAKILINKIVPDVKQIDHVRPEGEGEGDPNERGSLVERLTRRLTVIAEVVGERAVPQVAVEGGTSSPTVPLAALGSTEPAPPGRGEQRQAVADVAVARGPRVRQDKDGSGVDTVEG